jgi:hypothetical protein
LLNLGILDPPFLDLPQAPLVFKHLAKIATLFQFYRVPVLDDPCTKSFLGQDHGTEERLGTTI